MDEFNLDDYKNHICIIGTLLLIVIIWYSYSLDISQNIPLHDKYTYGVVLCCYNRPGYLEQTLQSLKESNLDNTVICIIDDHSTDEGTVKLINNYFIPGVKIIKIRNDTNIGINHSLYKGFTTIYPLCEYMTNIDSDVILKPHWLKTLYDTYESASSYKNGYIITGFNCVQSCNHKIIKSYPEFHVKQSIGGINMFFDKNIYDKIFREVLSKSPKNYGWDWNVVYKANSMNIVLLSTNPSVIQHIGYEGLNADGDPDIAEDY